MWIQSSPSSYQQDFASFKEYFKAFRQERILAITPKIISLGGKEYILLHVTIQHSAAIRGTDIWPSNEATIDDFARLPAFIEDFEFSWFSSSFDEINHIPQHECLIWNSLFVNGKVSTLSGPEISYNPIGLFDIYNSPLQGLPINVVSDHIVFLDTETTGLPKNIKASLNDLDNWPRVIQLAWIVTDLQGNIIEDNCKIVFPDGFLIPISASDINHIHTYEAENRGESLRHVLLQFLSSTFGAQCIVGHNVDFDLNVIRAEMLRCGIGDVTYGINKFCTMTESIQFCNLPKGKYPTLNELHMRLFGTPFDNAHDAMSDARATMRCYWEMKTRGIHYNPDDLPF